MNAISVAVVRRIAVAVGWISVAVAIARIAVAVAVGRITVPVSVIGPCESASHDGAKGEAAERQAPPAAPPTRISRAGRGNCGCEGGRRDESGQRFPHNYHLDVTYETPI